MSCGKRLQWAQVFIFKQYGREVCEAKQSVTSPFFLLPAFPKEEPSAKPAIYPPASKQATWQLQLCKGAGFPLWLYVKEAKYPLSSLRLSAFVLHTYAGFFYKDRKMRSVFSSCIWKWTVTVGTRLCKHVSSCTPALGLTHSFLKSPVHWANMHILVLMLLECVHWCLYIYIYLCNYQQSCWEVGRRNTEAEESLQHNCKA